MGVAIRTITDLQHLDDVNFTLGPGVDEYAVCWDNDTAKFVLRALADFGATGIKTDFIAESTSAAGVTIDGALIKDAGLTIRATSASATLGMTVADGTTRLTNYQALDLGNKTYVFLATNRTYGVDNWTSTGWYAARKAGSLQIENDDLRFYQFLASSNVSANVFSILTNGVTWIKGGLAVGYTAETTPPSNGLAVNGNVGIGTTAPATMLHVTSTIATTNALRNVLTLGANVTSTGVGAAGLGAAVLFTIETTTTMDTSAASVQAIIYEATHATRKFDLVGNAYDTTIREGWRVRGNGSAPAIGFLGATPQARIAHVADPAGGATVDAEARTAINSILSTLELFGLHSAS